MKSLLQNFSVLCLRGYEGDQIELGMGLRDVVFAGANQDVGTLLFFHSTDIGAQQGEPQGPNVGVVGSGKRGANGFNQGRVTGSLAQFQEYERVHIELVQDGGMDQVLEREFACSREDRSTQWTPSRILYLNRFQGLLLNILSTLLKNGFGDVRTPAKRKLLIGRDNDGIKVGLLY